MSGGDHNNEARECGASIVYPGLVDVPHTVAALTQDLDAMEADGASKAHRSQARLSADYHIAELVRAVVDARGEVSS